MAGEPSGDPAINIMATYNDEDDSVKMYDEFFEHVMHLINDHQKSPELIAGTLMALAQRIYKTQLDDDEYREMMEIVKDAPVKPFTIKKIKLN